MATVIMGNDPDPCEISNESDSNDEMDHGEEENNSFSPDGAKPYHMMDSKEKRR